MKKIYLVFKLMLVLSIVIISCKKEYSPTDAADDQIKMNDSEWRNQFIRDSLRKAGGVITYSINIIDGGAAGFSSKSSKEDLKAAAVTGAKIVAEQYGKTFVVTDTAGNGIVTIKDLRIGTVSVKITANGFTDCSYIASLTPDVKDDYSNSAYPNYDMWSAQRYVATMVPLFPTTGTNMATISGLVTLQSDLTNVGREIADSVDVIGVIDVDNADFVAKYMASYQHLNSSYWNLGATPAVNYYGQIVKIAYNSIVFKGTTYPHGVYTVRVPATGDGLPIRIEISEFAVDQTLLLNSLDNVFLTGPRVRPVRTLFSSNINLAGGTGFCVASAIPSVPAAYCTFDAPTGTGTANKPTVVATATATVSESGIVSVSVATAGLGYTQAPKVVIAGGASAIVNPARATAVIGTDGRVTDITLDNAGTGYTQANTTITLSGSETSTATATAVITYGVSTISMTAAGTYATAAAPAVTIYSSTGTGATGTARMTGRVNAITGLVGGVNYSAGTYVVFTGGGTSTPATGTVTVVGGIITAINIVTPGSGYTSAPAVTIVDPAGTGTGASATAEVRYGVAGVTITNAGSGYQAASVTFSATAPDVAATGTVNLANGVLSALTITDRGSGYTAAPNVIIGETNGGGASVPAVATAIVTNGEVTGFNITQGAGYTGAPSVAIRTYKVAATASVRCNPLAGQITAVTITDNGEGYNVAPIIEFYYPTTASTIGNGNGTKATATATISGGRVTDIAITNAGSGYYTAPLVRFTMPDVNMTAKASLTITADGYITGITIAAGDGGSGYTSVPLITINPAIAGVGSGAQAQVTKMDGGTVTEAKIINNGSGYVAKNNPASAEGFSVLTAGAASSTGTTINSISALSGKTYIRDIYLGTGKRTIEQ